MKRRPVHIGFASIALLSGALAAYQGWQWHRSERLNAQFAQAVRLAQSGKTEPALLAYKALSRSAHDDLKRASLYNLGNLYLHDVNRRGPDKAFETLPLIELAKQSYRDLLRAHPQDWDARYNLERALWLAPEVEPPTAEEVDPPEKEENVATTLQHAKIDLP